MLAIISSFDDFTKLAGAKHYSPLTETEKPVLMQTIPISDTINDYVSLQDATIVHRGGILCSGLWAADEIHYMPENWRQVDWLPGKISENGAAIALSEDTILAKAVIDSPVFFVDCSMGEKNFGHFVHDTISYAWMFKELRKVVPNLKPYARPFPFENQRRIFEYLFDIKLDDCVTQDPPFLVRELYVGRRQTKLAGESWSISHQGLRDAAVRLRQKWGAFSDSKPTRVLLHRSSDVAALMRAGLVLGRDYANVSDLSFQLLNHGYISFEPGKASLESIGFILGSAKEVVGIHGAGLANLIFCKPDTIIKEIVSHHGNWRSLEAISTVIGLNHRLVRQPAPLPGSPPLIDIRTIESIRL